MARKNAKSDKAVGKKPVKKRVSRKLTTNTKHSKWSDAQYWGFIRSGLRSKFSRYPVKFQVLRDASRSAVTTARGRKWEYQCAICLEWHVQANVEVDHIVPCGTLKCYADLPGFVERLFCASEGLRVVCKPCHKVKSQEERVTLTP